MDRDPGDFSAYAPHKPANDMSDDELTVWMASRPCAPGIRHIDDSDMEDEAVALVDVRAARYHDHATVSRWLRTWGTPDRRSFKDWLAAENDYGRLAG